jgi:hypothetical protein
VADETEVAVGVEIGDGVTDAVGVDVVGVVRPVTGGEVEADGDWVRIDVGVADALAVGDGLAVAVTEVTAVGVADAVAPEFDVAVALDVGVDVAVAVGSGVDVAVALDVGVAADVAVGVTESGRASAA